VTTNPDELPVIIPGSARLKCLPTYLVLDTSSSMEEHTELLNECLRSVHRAAYQDPDVSAFAHMSIIVFNSDPFLVLEMTDIRKVKKLPRLACSGLTEYAKAFNLVRERIDVDVPALVAANRHVLRPAVFFMTDGLPTDGMDPDAKEPNADHRIWKASLNRLVDENWERHPHVVTFGFGQANESVLGMIATLRAFLAENPAGEDESESLKKVFTTLIKTLTASAVKGQLQVPTDISGFRSVPIEDIR
jgi:uncharacterized protein YegL